VYSQFTKDSDEKKLMWQEVVIRELAVLINVSVEAVGQSYLIENKKVVGQLEKLLTAVVYKKEDENSVDIVNRLMNLLSKISRDSNGAQQIAESKNLVFRAILYFNKATYPIDIVMNSLRLLHNCAKSAQGFRELCLERHGFTLKNFDTVI
jgi:hypothetical protein